MLGREKIDPENPQVHLQSSEVILKIKWRAKDVYICAFPVKVWYWPQLTHHCLSFSLILEGGLTNH